MRTRAARLRWLAGELALLAAAMLADAYGAERSRLRSILRLWLLAPVLVVVMPIRLAVGAPPASVPARSPPRRRGAMGVGPGG